MSIILGTETYADLEQMQPRFFILPIGSYEQHGKHLPMVTDTLMALALSQSIAKAHQSHVLSPITISCSQEHDGFYGSTWISATTLLQMLQDILKSVERSGIDKLVIISGHGGNYGVSHFAQEMNIEKPRVLILPAKQHHNQAAKAAGLEKTMSEDMHGGEYETSVLLSAYPEYVKVDEIRDHESTNRPLLTLLGMKEYTQEGIIGFPSLATKEKGDKFLVAIADAVASDLKCFLDL